MRMKIQYVAMAVMVTMAAVVPVTAQAMDVGLVMTHRTGRATANSQCEISGTFYTRLVGHIVAYNLRQVRVNEERVAMLKMGHPVRLPTGRCSAVVRVGIDGTISYARITRCASRRLAKAELEALHRSSPLPHPSRISKVMINTIAPIATPGVNGGNNDERTHDVVRHRFGTLRK